MLSRKYLAGFFDGEGSVCVNKRNYTLQIQIGARSRDLLERMRKIYGGSIHQMKNKRIKRPFWVWIVVADKALKFLEDIYPHIVLKKLEVATAIAYQKHKVNLSRNYGHEYKFYEFKNRRLKRREWYWKRLKQLHHI
ncbi:MAG: LAGLIDADG family homing endonuclease [Candidatus Helarchaeota archaeon]